MDLEYADQFLDLIEWLELEPCSKAGGDQSVGITECLGNFCILGEDCYSSIPSTNSRTTVEEYVRLIGQVEQPIIREKGRQSVPIMVGSTAGYNELGGPLEPGAEY
jgi:hypothetical protein